MPARQLEQMLAVLPDIAAAVNRFSSPAVQTEVFWLLVMAADVDWRFVDWEHPALRLRGCANRRSVGLPSVAVVDEFDGDDEGDGEGELGESVLGAAVGVAAELSVVGQP